MDWLKKTWECSPEARRSMIEPDHPQISVARQWARVGGSRASFYEVSNGESREPLQCMRLIATPETRPPFDGGRRMTAW